MGQLSLMLLARKQLISPKSDYHCDSFYLLIAISKSLKTWKRENLSLHGCLKNEMKNRNKGLDLLTIKMQRQRISFRLSDWWRGVSFLCLCWDAPNIYGGWGLGMLARSNWATVYHYRSWLKAAVWRFKAVCSWTSFLPSFPSAFSCWSVGPGHRKSH